MGRTIMGAAVTLDGFIADDHDGVRAPLRLVGNGDVAWTFPGGHLECLATRATADVMRTHHRDVAAVVIGRRLFVLTNGWPASPPPASTSS